MALFRIEGGARLEGEARVQTAKNAVLPLLAAALLAEDDVVIRECPALSDVSSMLEILRTLGCACERRGPDAIVRPQGACRWEIPQRCSRLLRSSIFLLGPIAARFGRAQVAYPGGCEIGLRPIDLHIRGLRALGVDVREEGGMVLCRAGKLRGADLSLPFPSVGATENIMMAAALAEGDTTIRGAAREPEVRDLARFLNAMGARVDGAGSARIAVRGVKRLRGVEYRPMPDRIEAGTLLTAAAATGGEIALSGAEPADMRAILCKLRTAGCRVEAAGERILLRAQGPLRAVDIATRPYPGFPTDMQPQMAALCAAARGAAVFRENLFESRFGYAEGLRRMGARIAVHGRTAWIRGGRLHGARVAAGDLRGGAALVIAALAAEGESSVEGLDHIDRGYCRLEEKLRRLGARIQRIEGP